MCQSVWCLDVGFLPIRKRTFVKQGIRKILGMSSFQDGFFKNPAKYKWDEMWRLEMAEKN